MLAEGAQPVRDIPETRAAVTIPHSKPVVSAPDAVRPFVSDSSRASIRVALASTLAASQSRGGASGYATPRGEQPVALSNLSFAPPSGADGPSASAEKQPCRLDATAIPCLRRGCVARMAIRAALNFRASTATIRQAPGRTLTPPLLVLLSCLAFGLLAVMLVAAESRQQARTNAGFAAANAITALKQRMDGLLSPLAAVVTYVSQRPNCTALELEYTALAGAAMKWAPNQASVLELQLVPAGVLTMMWPPGSSPGAIGLDVFNHPFRRDDALRVAAGGVMTLEGPYNLVEGGFAAIAYEPIYTNAAYAVDGVVQGCSRGPHNCSTECNSAPGEAFWGFACALLDVEPLADRSDPTLVSLAAEGYRYRLWRPATTTNADIAIAATPSWPVDPVISAITFYNATWTLAISPTAGWAPPWRAPCIAAVVVGSLILSGLLLLLLVAKEQHEQLLKQMLPAKAINWLQAGKGAFVDFFETTTILFSDCVSYTSMSSELSPLDVVTILNELYERFDSLTTKHGVYKVETIGDAFMCTAGCPNPEDGPSGAERIAAMALDMISAVEGFVSSNGHRMQIRVGMHSGPVVAGVIGTRMPRYCLFGDTVNTASRMESNSAAMRVHVSAATAGLLRQAHEARREAAEGKGQAQGPAAPAAFWRLSSRGTITVKGKGEMETFWLESSDCPPLSVPGPASDGAVAAVSRQPSALRSPPSIARLQLGSDNDLGAGHPLARG